jgi:hypothetical protein
MAICGKIIIRHSTEFIRNQPLTYNYSVLRTEKIISERRSITTIIIKSVKNSGDDPK